MSDAMVTGRMPSWKKQQGNAVLQDAGITASKLINAVYDRMIKEQSVSFIYSEERTPTLQEWEEAFRYIDALSEPKKTRFDGMTAAQIKAERLASRGLM